MRETRNNITCDIGFGKSAQHIMEICIPKGMLPNMDYIGLPNPLPTGDHWKVIEWLNDFKKRGPSMLTKIPNSRRDFIKKATAQLAAGKGFHMEIVSMVARKFRDDNNLRMQRGKVYVFVTPQKNDGIDAINSAIEKLDE